jgi:hypothetical protein
MAYTLKYSDGRLFLNLPDQESNRVATSLTLIGKNVNAYGTDINQNYIKLLENFANSVEPTAPMVGQIWYDTSKQQIKVYTKNREFKPVGAPIIAATKPAGLAIGDLWYDTTAEQLKFQTNGDLVVIGPQTDSSIGRSGWINSTLTTINSETVTVEALYSNDKLMAILSDTPFTITGTTTSTNMRDIGVGITANYSDGLEVEFRGTATYARNLIREDGAIISATSYLSNSPDFIRLDYPLYLYNSTLTIAAASGRQDIQLYSSADSTLTTLLIGEANENFELRVTSEFFPLKGPILHASAREARLGIFNSNPLTDVDINGDVTVRGNLIVDGGLTYITTQDILVEDKTITVNSRPVGTPMGLNDADNSGIEVYTNTGDPNTNYAREIKWRSLSPNGSISNVWRVTDNLQLAFVDSAFYINDQMVLSRTSLGPTVTSAPNLTEIGNLTTATLAGIRFSSEITTTTSRVKMIPIAPTSGESILQIGQANINPTIDFAGCELINVKAPGPGSSTSTVATKGYVDLAINQDRQVVVGVTIDVSGEGDAPNDPGVDDHVIKILTVLYDPSLPFPYATPAGTIAKVLVTRSNTTATSASTFIPGEVPSSVAGLPVDVINGEAQTVTVVQYNPNFQVEVNVPKRVLEIDKCIKQYILTGSDPNGPFVWAAYPSANIGNILWPQAGVAGWYPAVQPLE